MGHAHLLLGRLLDVFGHDLVGSDLQVVCARYVLEVFCLQPEHQVLFAVPVTGEMNINHRMSLAYFADYTRIVRRCLTAWHIVK
eukprot:50570-Eustigmatos_ZCMA.PRE.1